MNRRRMAVIGAAVALLILLIVGFATDGFGLFGGNNGARILAAIVFAINVIGSIYLLFTFQTSFWSALWSGIFPLIGLLLLFTRSANAFFARR